MNIPASCMSDISSAADELKRERPDEFRDLGRTQPFGLYVFSYSLGSFVGPAVAGVIKAKASWGAATLILAAVCALACVPIVSCAGFVSGAKADRPSAVLQDVVALSQVAGSGVNVLRARSLALPSFSCPGVGISCLIFTFRRAASRCPNSNSY